MINEPHLSPKGTGWIEVIAGCMFSGKTDELIRRLRRAEIAKQKVIVFKPSIDNRYSNRNIVSHNEQSLPSVTITDPQQMIELSVDFQVVGVDEAQFFGNGLVDTANFLADKGKRVIIAGLDMDYKAVPFEPMPQLLAVAEYITKTLAICVVCGNPADRTQRKSFSSERVLVGAAESYEARCRKCHFIQTED
ncbi:MAG: thymidine kinase [Ignavibacteria bacterium]|nr:thymidine kinase [Ignavibacteria bacterium]